MLLFHSDETLLPGYLITSKQGWGGGYNVFPIAVNNRRFYARKLHTIIKLN